MKIYNNLSENLKKQKKRMILQKSYNFTKQGFEISRSHYNEEYEVLLSKYIYLRKLQIKKILQIVVSLGANKLSKNKYMKKK